MLAGTKVIPLAVKESLVREAEKDRCPEWPVVVVLHYRVWDVGIIVTGNEVFHRRIQDRFGPVLRKKIEFFSSRLLHLRLAPDDPERIAQSIGSIIADGAGLVLVSGGMSVDPDDVTPQGIALAGADYRGLRGAHSPRGDVHAGLPSRGACNRSTRLRHVLPDHRARPGAAVTACG